MTPRPRSKRDLASDHIERALSEASQALSKLGGKVRYGSKKLPPDNSYIARQYLEGIISRLRVVQLLALPGGITKDMLLEDLKVPNKQKLEELYPEIKRDRDWASDANLAAFPRDSFEEEYDSTREPKC